MIADLIYLSFKNIFRKGFRSVLTILGIAVGVASVVLINAAGDMGTAAVNHELDSLGLNGITVSAMGENMLDEADIKAIESMKDVTCAMPVITSETIAYAYNNECDVMAWGIGDGEQQVMSLQVIYGRCFSQSDIDGASYCCMIDENVSKSLFGRKNSVGKKISLPISGAYESFEIVGITKADSSILQSLMGDIVPNFAYIPYSTMGNMFGISQINQIAVRLSDSCNVDEVSGQIVQKIDMSKGMQDTVKTDNLSAQRDKLDNLLSVVSVVLSVIGAISLLVAGLGIMTVMLVSVNERTREIGVKKAIGAGFGKIMLEFMFEALTISAIGSIIGAILGVAFSFIGGGIVGMDVNISFFSVAGVTLAAMLTGVIFGVYPAYKAARLEPIEALRYE